MLIMPITEKSLPFIVTGLAGLSGLFFGLIIGNDRGRSMQKRETEAKQEAKQKESAEKAFMDRIDSIERQLARAAQNSSVSKEVSERALQIVLEIKSEIDKD